MPDLLFIAHRVPFPPDRGDKIRSYHLLKHLAAQGRVHLAAFIEEEDELAMRAGLQPLVASMALVRRTKGKMRAAVEALATGRPVSLTAFDHPAMHRAVRQQLSTGAIDTIMVFSSQMAAYAEGFGGRMVMDFVDMDSAKFAAYAESSRGPMRWMMGREARLLLANDAQVARRATTSLFVSEAEAALFRRSTGAEHVHTIENGIDTNHYDPAEVQPIDAARPLIVFTGQMDYRPNIDAVRRFVREVWPAVRAAVPAAHFAIVGRDPTREVTELGRIEGVIVTGAVTDVRPWLAGADMVVAPLGIARGIQNKVLEAMAMARPVVASPQAADGIDHKGTILIAEPGEQARAIIGLLGNAAAASELGYAARAQVMARYGWDARLAPLDRLLDARA